ncbi:MAG: hypothetical protein K6E93_07685 [Bacteroidales bacterium]|nr:hypothetical protein [Bacteroidales bacterium]
MKKKKILAFSILVVMVGMTTLTSAQQIRSFESRRAADKLNMQPFGFSLSFGGTTYDMSEKDIPEEGFHAGFRPALEFNYSHRFNQNMGVRVGLGLAYGLTTYESSNLTLDLMEQYDTFQLDYRRTAKYVEERYQYLQAELPVLLTWQSDWIYGGVGIKAAMPLFRHGKYAYRGIHAEAYRPSTGGAAINDDPRLDCGELADYISSIDQDELVIPFWVMATAEFGIHFYSMRKRESILVLFMDYSLNQGNPMGNKDIVTYRTEAGCQKHDYASCIGSAQISPFRCFNFGLKYTFKLQ